MVFFGEDFITVKKQSNFKWEDIKHDIISEINDNTESVLLSVGDSIKVSNQAIQDSLAEGISAMRRRNYSEALEHFGLLPRIEPEFAEGWNKRATVLYLIGRYGESEADVYKTLLLEPRHFGALSGMGLIRIARKDWGGAVDALEAGLKIHPNMPGALKNLEFARKKQKESMT